MSDKDPAGAVDRLADLGFAAGWSLVRALPEWVADPAFRVVADVAFRRRGPMPTTSAQLWSTSPTPPSGVAGWR